MNAERPTTNDQPRTTNHGGRTPMARIGKFILAGVVGLVICLGLGFAWGVAGRGELQGMLDSTRQRLDVAEARGHILDARVSLYNNNFGDASRHFEEAKGALRRV